MANILEQLRERLNQYASVLEDIDEADVVKSAKDLLKAVEEALDRHAERAKEKEQPK